MADLVSTWTSQITGFLSTQMWVYLFYGIVGVAVVWFIYSRYKFKKLYRYSVRVYSRRENGKVKERNFLGAYISVNGIQKFRVKLGSSPWNYKELPTTPSPEFMDEDDRVYYWQINEATWVQVRRLFYEQRIVNENGEIAVDDNGRPIVVEYPMFEPISQLDKEAIKFDIVQARGVLEVDKNKQIQIFTVGLIILAIVFVVAYYLLMNKGQIF